MRGGPCSPLRYFFCARHDRRHVGYAVAGVRPLTWQGRWLVSLRKDLAFITLSIILILKASVPQGLGVQIPPLPSSLTSNECPAARMTRRH